jgi:microcystin-dependent protein
MRGRGAVGFDDMGNTAAGVLVAGTPTVISTGGAEKQTIAQANLPSVNFDITGLTGSVSTTITNGTLVERNASTQSNTATTGAGSRLSSSTSSTLSLASGAVTFGGSVPSGGSGTTLTTTPPYFLGTWYLKL